MSHSSGGSVGGGPDFHLPDEILAVMPTDPYDQLDLARKITSMAIASRVSKMEAEMGRIRQKLYEKDRVISELEDRLSHMQKAYQEADSRLKILVDDNTKLSKERDSLAMTAKNLSRDLAKLETFKRQLMQSLSDDNSSRAETVDIGTCDQSAPRAYPDKDEGSNGYAAQRSLSGSTDMGNAIDEASRNTVQRFSLTPYITPRLTPTGTPKVISTSVSPSGYSLASSPKRTSSTTSPSKAQYDGRASLSSWYPSSQQSSAANSPPRGRSLPGRTPRIDGKEFFRQARSRLSYEQFSAFLANIKELNAQKQNREETLRKAEEIFGTDNKDLYLYFQGLLHRNAH
ncbi:WAT1-related protein [Melia azedarach]|uniref:WAT1-related protein n=2 Tax=Melia azedarach TaxID=155640 RepID=A0ACC1X424_MELAZ|nr:WAT1-related protein [Melia azedarach]KAJ4705824.1 WAT1-related protein [Melia azedarach]